MNNIKYCAPDGGLHESKEKYLEGVILDLRGNLTGKQVLIDELLNHIKEVTGRTYDEWLECDEDE